MSHAMQSGLLGLQSSEGLIGRNVQDDPVTQLADNAAAQLELSIETPQCDLGVSV